MSAAKRSKAEQLSPPGLLACSASSLTLSWRAARGATDYAVRWSREDDSASFVSVPARDNPLATTHRMEELTAGTGYIFQVRPLFGNERSPNGWGWSSSSAAFTPMESDDDPPSQPAGHHSSSEQRGYVLTFPANNWQPFYRMKTDGTDDPTALSLSDILSEDPASSAASHEPPRITDIVLFNMHVSTSKADKIRSWLGTRWGTAAARVSVRVFCDKNETGSKREGSFASHPKLSVTPIDVSDCKGAKEIFGHHHSKLCVVLYTTGVRLAVLTSNLRAAELDLMTNAVWTQDFPLKLAEGAGGGGESEFERDLCDYLSHKRVQGGEKERGRERERDRDKGDEKDKKDKKDKKDRDKRGGGDRDRERERETPTPSPTPIRRR